MSDSPAASRIVVITGAANGIGRATSLKFAADKPVLALLDREQAAAEIAALTNIAQRLNRFLSLSKDPHELAGLLIPNYESFYWNNPATRAQGLSVFGF